MVKEVNGINFYNDSKSTNVSSAIAAVIAFEKKNMKTALKDKVRRNNNLAVEIQGAFLITSK